MTQRLLGSDLLQNTPTNEPIVLPVVPHSEVQQILRHANVTTTINIYVKMVTQDAEDAMKKLESKCSLVVPQLSYSGYESGAKLGNES
jgi:hypothetical protein